MQAGILNKSEEHLWSEFVQNHPFGTIHQTPEWGHFQEKVEGRGKYWIIVLTDANNEPNLDNAKSQKSSPNNSDSSRTPKILAGALLIRHKLPKGYCWLYAPRGPLLDYESSNQSTANLQMDALLPEIKKIAKQEKAIFLRIDPPLPEKSAHLLAPSATHIASFPLPATPTHPSVARPPLHFPHFRRGVHGFQPDHTLILDLAQSEQDLLAQMKPKGRYNIKLAEKKGVKIRRAGSTNGSKSFNPGQFQKDLKSFHKILTETTSRDGFHGHDENFYKNMIEDLQNNPAYSNSSPGVSQNSNHDSVNPHSPYATLYLAEYDNQVIAACLNTFFKDTATYYYGASSNLHRNVMAPYLLHWQAIKDAKQKGCKFYDFFGIAPTHERSEHINPHPWSGVTDFKKKFGGQEISYQKPQEFPFKKTLYLLYRAYKKFK